MELTYQVHGLVLVVELAGEWDMHGTPAFRSTVDALLERHSQLKHLLLVLAEVTFIDSAGLGAILGRCKTIQERGGRLVIVQAQKQVRRVLELSGLQQVASFAASVDEGCRLAEGGAT